MCIYCSYGNLDLLVLLHIYEKRFYSCRWLLQCAAEILVDFSKTYYHRFY